MTYQGYLGERTFLYIKARCQPKQWRQDELELKITSMELLPDVKEKLIEKINDPYPARRAEQGIGDGIGGTDEGASRYNGTLL